MLKILTLRVSFSLLLSDQVALMLVHIMQIYFVPSLFFVFALLRDYSLCWDRWKRYMTLTLDAALLIVV